MYPLKSRNQKSACIQQALFCTILVQDMYIPYTFYLWYNIDVDLDSIWC